ncbi:MAG: rod-binding protein [Kiloniellales bacterium]
MMDINTMLAAHGAAPTGSQTTAAQAERERQAEETGKKFESMFLAQMLAPMFDGLGEDSPFGGQTAKAYRSVMLQEYGEAMSAAGGIGIADQVKAEILKLQEVAQ